MKCIFPYVGGKHRVAARLAALLLEHACYVEVFGGALNVFFAKEPSKREVVNDINGDLINIFRIVRYHPDEFFKELAFITYSRREFLDCHAQPGLTDVQRAARYYYLLKTSYGGTASAGHKNFGVRITSGGGIKLNILATISAAHQRLKGAIIENLDFADLIHRYDRDCTCFFCDPPYLSGADYGIPFKYKDHQHLAEALKTIKGKFLLTINDHLQIRKLYRGLPQLKRKVKCSISRDKSLAARDRVELIIANYPLPARW